MTRGDKTSYTDKQQRQASHIEASEKARGRSTTTAERIAWATVNKQDGGGKKAAAGTSARKAPAKKTAAKTTATKRVAKKASPTKKAARLGKRHSGS